MSRFGEGDGEEFAGQYVLWEANARRALGGKRGQAALRDLESALVELPSKRLISGHLAHRGEVCAIGALVAHRRALKGEDRDVVLRELAAAAPALCECQHSELDHIGLVGHCTGCDVDRERVRKHWEDVGREPDEAYLARVYGCESFVDAEESDGDYGLITVEAAQTVGVSYVMAWEIAWANDERYQSCTPEERYEKTLAWVRAAIIPDAVAA